MNAIVFLYKRVLDMPIDDRIEALRAKKPKRLPTVLSRAEVRNLMSNMKGTNHLMAMLLYGSGLRLMECVRLRVMDIDFDNHLIVVRDGNGNKDRSTLLPEILQKKLKQHLLKVKKIHQQDLEDGFGEVYLSNALSIKLKGAGKSWKWQYVFPSQTNIHQIFLRQPAWFFLIYARRSLLRYPVLFNHQESQVMKMSAQEFLDWESKRITLLAMSGAGKTTLANKLPKQKWFHYSGDYRIGTKYLEEPILDNIKRQAMDVPFLRDLLLSDSIYICNNITVDNLTPVSSFLGKLGSPDKGGLSLEEFKRRQHLHRHAEIMAMRDVPEFIHKAEDIYGYKHFVNDAGGSVCELDDPETLEILAQHTLIVYLKIPEQLEQTIIDRAVSDPKPMYYREAFLDEKLDEYLNLKKLRDTNEVDPDDFVRWVFPELFRSRLPRYQKIAERYGYTIDAGEAATIEGEEDFHRLIANAIDEQSY